MQNLVIVESPSKSKTIEKYLGKDYKVVSSKGHIRDLKTTGKYGLGVDIDNGFKPEYEPIKGKKKVIDDLKKQAKQSSMVYLASDPDREGEAIAWHLKDAIGLKDKDYRRVVFNEITKDKVLESFKTPRMIDDNLVKSQEARRILDRIIGFRLSKLMQSKTGGKSAGRVQSVALKLIVDREDEINAFIPTEYHTITAVFDEFEADLYAKLINNKEEELTIPDEQTAKDIISQLNKEFNLKEQTKKSKNKKSPLPFTTSTLQQLASTKLGFSGKKTMNIAQKLYEGIDLEHETTGLITYMRTDSIRLSDEFIQKAYKYINDNYGKEYVGYVKQTTKKENVQDAHEAIRPTNLANTPETVKKYLSNDEYKLYKLIYTRALSSLFSDAKQDQTTIILDNNSYLFKATGSIITFDGYLKIYKEYEDITDNILPNLDENTNSLISQEIKEEKHFTKPKPRYTEAKLIKELEELGIGRPSTYVKIIDTIKEREYVKLEDKKFVPTEIGILTTRKLQEFFSSLINVEYTKDMETDLDKVAEGQLIWNDLLARFYKDFAPQVDNAFKKMEKASPKQTGELCPLCKSPLVIRNGKYGDFTACSNYPACKYIKKEEKPKEIVATCPKCHNNIIEKKTRKGKIFYGCEAYPKCDFALWDKPINEMCPNCGNILVETKNAIKCSQCDYVK